MIFPSVFLLLLSWLNGPPVTAVRPLAPGKMPALFTDDRGTLHLTFGRSDTIFYAASTDGGLSFTKPVSAGVLPDLVAGAKRGPQVAANAQVIVITAVNRAGNLFAYRLDRSRGTWQAGGPLNDVPDVAKEGFQGLAVGGNGTFHAAWLDLRGDRQNKIVGSTSADGGMTWAPNRVLYRSPDSTVCECCQVSVAAQGQHVYVQFRNFLNGSRDLHLLHSADGGRSYGPAQKLGQGTWKLKACPMDGGRVALTPDAQPLTVWRREGTIYFCKPGQPEQAVAEGRNCTLAATAAGPMLAWEQRGILFLKTPQGEAIALGEGQLPSLAATATSTVCAWEQNGRVVVATVPLQN